jgi:uncharacterized phage protein (TIGR01671 family)
MGKMREIKFRAYNRNTKNMWWFDLMWGNTDTHGSGWIGMLPIGETREHNGGINGSDNRTQVDPTDCEIMQFTGLKDKNGKEIYEGDILKHDLWGLDTVVWDDECAMFRCKNEGNGCHDITLAHHQLNRTKVVGNIYENPEYLVSK